MQKLEVTPNDFGSRFLNGDFSAIYQQTTEEFKQLATLEQFIEYGESFNNGVETYSLEMSTNLNKYITQYLWLDNEREKAIGISFDENNTIYGISLAPFVSFPESDQQYTKNTYIMPIKEEWFVFWGGTNQFINYHYVYADQRYAYDLIIMKDGQSYSGPVKENESYYAFNKEIIAPAEGKIVKIVDGIKDNVPGEFNPEPPEGNCVIIEHKNNEYSMLAHLKQSSILVSEGDFVQQGEVIGVCGNSGNSSEPHLHFQVMNSINYLKGQSIRIRFENGLEPIQGDFVSPFTS
ncbi:M23 family metallopeptidase [Pseudobacillus sp. 179-B 2D1 NHS]|uniref:M23 family metallopeptidase n=1 Tax=Pseudobacillus sp. 179-B 2D1 NHS TaxID=3374292 RepID=UPI00387A8167